MWMVGASVKATGLESTVTNIVHLAGVMARVTCLHWSMGRVSVPLTSTPVTWSLDVCVPVATVV